MKSNKAFPLLVLLLGIAEISRAFCGFYVAKADAKLFNNKSEVIMVRDGNRNVITMSSDYSGSLKDFAMVVPVPVLLRESDIRVVERRLFDVLNDYSAPRLVEYYDSNPCYREYPLYDALESTTVRTMAGVAMNTGKKATEKDFGVTIEAQYSIEEYDVLILSAKESNGLKDWLILNGYKIPETAENVLEPYIKSNMKFFVVKVNLNKMAPSSTGFLRPLQLSFTHEKFMLPLRLGMANSQGAQDMIVYAFTRSGRIECTNYRTVKLPTDRNIPLYIQPKFGEFYKALFDRAYASEGKNSVFLEYAWNVSPFNSMKCDPCVGPPPINQDFANAGVDWMNSPNPTVFFTRLHVRYGREKFPSDLQFQVTPNNENYQCRYILTHPAQGSFDCAEGQQYLQDLYNKRKREIDEVYALTRWMDPASGKYLNEYNHHLKSDVQKNPKKGESPIFIRSKSGSQNKKILAMSILSLFAGIGLLLTYRSGKTPFAN